MNATHKTNTGLSLAAAAAALFLAAPIARAGDDQAAGSAPMGHCMGANACKGQSACMTAANACSGQNACKGQGYTVTTAEDCKAVNGKFEAADADDAAKPAPTQG